MTFRLRFPTLFSLLAPAPVRAPLAALALSLGALAGCEGPSPHPLLDAPTEPARQTEPAAPSAASPPVPHVHESVAPGTGAIRLPSALQSYGLYVAPDPGARRRHPAD